MISDLLSQPYDRTEEGEQILKEVWERMKKEKEINNSIHQNN